MIIIVDINSKQSLIKHFSVGYRISQSADTTENHNFIFVDHKRPKPPADNIFGLHHSSSPQLRSAFLLLLLLLVILKAKAHIYLEYGSEQTVYYMCVARTWTYVIWLTYLFYYFSLQLNANFELFAYFRPSNFWCSGELRQLSFVCCKYYARLRAASMSFMLLKYWCFCCTFARNVFAS